MRRVHVRWHDAHSCATGWIHVADIDPDPYVVDTIGWLLEPSPKPGHVVVAQTVADDVDDPALDHVIAIPAEMVVALTHLDG